MLPLVKMARSTIRNQCRHITKSKLFLLKYRRIHHRFKYPKNKSCSYRGYRGIYHGYNGSLNRFCTSRSPTTPALSPAMDSSSSSSKSSTTSSSTTTNEDRSKHPEEMYHYEQQSSSSDPNAKVIFELIFGEISTKVGGDHNMVFPKDIMWLCGAPGSGKGEMTEWIKYQRGYHSEPIKISEILRGPEIELIKSEGKLVSDRIVLTILLEKLLLPDYKTGVIVDGFPRTPLQAECIKLLFDKMLATRRKYDGTIHFTKFRRPVFHITVLYVDAEVSVQRQLKRGKLQLEHNDRVYKTGIGELIQIRETDSNENKAKERYKYFQDYIYSSIQLIKEKFPFHFISAEADIDTVRQRVLKELEYQSSSELGDETFDMIRQISLASEIKQNARHKLVERLDSYTKTNELKILFQDVINLFKFEFEPYIRQQALTGTCIVSSDNKLFLENKISLTMMLDILSERGYRVILDVIKKDPEIIEIDLKNGQFIKSNKKSKIFKFHISFPPPKMRHAMQTYDTDVHVVQ